MLEAQRNFLTNTNLNMSDNLEIPRSIVIKRIYWFNEMFNRTGEEKYKAIANELRALLEFYGGDDD